MAQHGRQLRVQHQAHKAQLSPIQKTSFWLCPDHTLESGLTMVFVHPKDKELGEQLSSDAITQATNKAGDISLILGSRRS